jgi:hypothetical protein
MNALTMIAGNAGKAVSAVKAGMAGRAGLVAAVIGIDVNPTPQAPPGVESTVQTILNWLMWGGLIAAIIGFIAGGITLMISNERGMGNENVKKLGYVCMGAVVVSAAAGLAKVLVG